MADRCFPVSMNELIVNFAPTGMVATRERSPHVPLTPQEIIDSVLEAHAIGITLAHLHVRDPEGVPTLSPDVYEEILLGIRRDAPDLVLCLSLSGRLEPDFEPRRAPLGLKGMAKPDMASLTLGSLNFPGKASINQPDVIVGLAQAMRVAGILPELEAFDSGMLQVARGLIADGVLRTPCYMNLIFGNRASAQLDFLDVANMTSRLPDSCYSAFGGIGHWQLPANALAVAMGTGVRVGLEDNLYLRRRELATNAQLLQRVHRLADLHERAVMTPARFRELMRLKPGGGEYGTLE